MISAHENAGDEAPPTDAAEALPALVLAPSAALALAAELGTAAGFARESRSERTRSAYRYQWAAFVAWCGARALDPCPAQPATLAAYVADRATVSGWKVASIGQSARDDLARARWRRAWLRRSVERMSSSRDSCDNGSKGVVDVARVEIGVPYMRRRKQPAPGLGTELGQRQLAVD